MGDIMDICQVDQMNRKEFIEMVFCTNEDWIIKEE